MIRGPASGSARRAGCNGDLDLGAHFLSVKTEPSPTASIA